MTADKNTADPGEVQVYNLDHTHTPGGMKVRWRIRTATGKEAERLEKQQNQAIIKLLTWADQYLGALEENTSSGQVNNGNVSRETSGNVTVMSPGRSRIRNEKAAEKGHAA
jgi:hypothetical protein